MDTVHSFGTMSIRRACLKSSSRFEWYLSWKTLREFSHSRSF